MIAAGAAYGGFVFYSVDPLGTSSEQRKDTQRHYFFLGLQPLLQWVREADG